MKACLFLFACVLTMGSAFAQTKIMCLGDSITKGAVDSNPTMSGYRAQLFTDLNNGGYKYQFIGCTINNSNRRQIAALQAYHNGYGSFRMDQIFHNFEGVENAGNADDNMGGYWMVGGHDTYRDPAFPDLVLLLAGTNDLGSGSKEPELEKRMTDILSWFQSNRPQAQIFIGTVPPRGMNKEGWEPYNVTCMTFNSWITRTIPTMSSNFHVVDIYSIFMDGISGKTKMPDSSDGIFLQDGIHPTHNGYVAMGDAWFKAITPYLTKADSVAASNAPAASVTSITPAAPTAVTSAPALPASTGAIQKIVSPQDALQGVKLTVKGGATILTADGDYGGFDGNDERPANALDGDPTTKYLCHIQSGTKDPGIDTGLLITPKIGSTIVTAFQIYAGNDTPERDPVAVTLEGSNDPKAANEGFKDFTLIYEGKSGLDSDPDRGNVGAQVTFPNATAYKTYRLLVTKTRATTDSTQIGEVVLLGKPSQ